MRHLETHVMPSLYVSMSRHLFGPVVTDNSSQACIPLQCQSPIVQVLVGPILQPTNTHKDKTVSVLPLC